MLIGVLQGFLEFTVKTIWQPVKRKAATKSKLKPARPAYAHAYVRQGIDSVAGESCTSAGPGYGQRGPVRRARRGRVRARSSPPVADCHHHPTAQRAAIIEPQDVTLRELRDISQVNQGFLTSVDEAIRRK